MQEGEVVARAREAEYCEKIREVQTARISDLAKSLVEKGILDRFVLDEGKCELKPQFEGVIDIHDKVVPILPLMAIGWKCDTRECSIEADLPVLPENEEKFKELVKQIPRCAVTESHKYPKVTHVHVICKDAPITLSANVRKLLQATLKCREYLSKPGSNPAAELTVGYHVTKATDVPKILSEGLTPRVGPRTRQLLPIEPYEESVFIWPTLADAEEFKAIVEYFEEKNEWVILKIKNPTRFKHRIVKWGAGLAATEIRILEKIPPSEIAVYEGSNPSVGSNPPRAEPLIPYWALPAAFTLILVGAAFAGWVASQLEGEA